MAYQEMTQALLAADGSLFNITYADLGPQLIMQGHYSSPSSGSQYIDTGMQQVFMIAVTGADYDQTTASAQANGTYRVIFSGLTTGLTGEFFIWGA